MSWCWSTGSTHAVSPYWLSREVAAVVVAGFVGLSKLGTNHPVAPGGGDSANRGGGVISADPVIDNQVGGELPPAMNPEGGPSVVLPLHIKPVDFIVCGKIA